MEEIKQKHTYKASFENSKRLIEQSVRIDRRINDMVFCRNCLDPTSEIRKKIVSDVNKAVFELAEKKGMSVYDICFRTVPVEEPLEPKFSENGFTMEGQISLVPIEFELEKGPGYWKGKYYRLKEKLQELIDNKDD